MTSERWDWVDRIAHHLIHRAARRAPDSLSERLEEEWLADLAAQRGPIPRLRFALGCCWATNVIAHEHAVAALPATSSPVGHANFVHQDDSPFLTGRTITFVLVASIHAAVLYGLAMGLGPQFTKIIVGPFVTRVVEPPPRSSLPPPPRPQVSPTTIELPPQAKMPPIESDQTDVQATPRCPCQRLPRLIACREDRELDFRVPTISTLTHLFAREKRGLRRSGHASTGRGASFPSRRSSNRPEVRGSMRAL
jgi:hypothetical protein